MFSKLALAGLLSLTSAVAMATVNLGSYTGQTQDNQECALEITQADHAYDVKVSFKNEDAESEVCQFKSSHTTESKKELKVSGGSAADVCKVRVALANDGTPIKAQMGVGQYFQFGFDVTCSNLQKN